jgi:hypothetical protein
MPFMTRSTMDGALQSTKPGRVSPDRVAAVAVAAGEAATVAAAAEEADPAATTLAGIEAPQVRYDSIVPHGLTS